MRKIDVVREEAALVVDAEIDAVHPSLGEQQLIQLDDAFAQGFDGGGHCFRVLSQKMGQLAFIAAGAGKASGGQAVAKHQRRRKSGGVQRRIGGGIDLLDPTGQFQGALYKFGIHGQRLDLV